MNLTTTTDSSRDTTINNMLIMFVIFCLVLFLGLIVFIIRVNKNIKVYPRILDVSVRGTDEDF